MPRSKSDLQLQKNAKIGLGAGIAGVAVVILILLVFVAPPGTTPTTETPTGTTTTITEPEPAAPTHALYNILQNPSFEKPEQTEWEMGNVLSSRYFEAKISDSDLATDGDKALLIKYKQAGTWVYSTPRQELDLTQFNQHEPIWDNLSIGAKAVVPNVPLKIGGSNLQIELVMTAYFYSGEQIEFTAHHSILQDLRRVNATDVYTKWTDVRGYAGTYNMLISVKEIVESTSDPSHASFDIDSIDKIRVVFTFGVYKNPNTFTSLEIAIDEAYIAVPLLVGSEIVGAQAIPGFSFEFTFLAVFIIVPVYLKMKKKSCEAKED